MNITVPTLFASILFPFLASAATVLIENNVSVEATSGGSVAESGQVVEGKSSATVKVHTVVDGETVEDWSETAESDGTGEVEIKRSSVYATSSASVKTDVSAEAKKSSKQFDVLLEVKKKSHPTSSQNSPADVRPTSTGTTSLEARVQKFSLKRYLSNVIRYAFKFFTK